MWISIPNVINPKHIPHCNVLGSSFRLFLLKVLTEKTWKSRVQNCFVKMFQRIILTSTYHTHSAIRASFSLILFSSMFIVLSLERADDSPSLSLCCNVATSTVSISFWSLRSSICAFRLPSFASHSYGTTEDEWVQIWLKTLSRACGLRVD